MINLPFPFKFNDKFDIENPMRRYVEAYYDQNAYKQIADVIIAIQKMRNSLDFFNMSSSLQKNPKIL